MNINESRVRMWVRRLIREGKLEEAYRNSKLQRYGKNWKKEEELLLKGFLRVGDVDIIDIGRRNIALVPSGKVEHAQRHNVVGEGSVFRKGLTKEDIVSYVKEAGKSVEGSGGLYRVPCDEVVDVDIIDIGRRNIALVPSGKVEHAQRHNVVGEGSVFRKGLTKEDIVSYVKEAGKSVEGSGGLYRVPCDEVVGYNLVMKVEEAKRVLGRDWSEKNAVTVVKTDNDIDYNVLGIKTSVDIENFETSEMCVVLREANPSYMPDFLKRDPIVSDRLIEKKCYMMLTMFPGDPNIPRVTEWGGDSLDSAKYVIIIPE